MKGKAIAGLVLGIVGLVFSFCGTWFSIIALPIAIVGLILSIVGRKQLVAAGSPAGIGTAALIVSIIAVVFAVIFFFTCGVCTLAVIGAANDGSLESSINGALNDILG